MSKKVSRKVLKMKRKERLKHRRKKFFIAISIGIAILLSSTFLIYTLIINNKLKDLNYAIDYHFTSRNIKSDRLLRVQQYDLLFADGDNVIVEAHGLSHEEPHAESSVKAKLTKNKKGIWELNKETLVANEK
ncbi:hypothetical protein [Clostridium septicum]|uniref:Uncharacterized protein n=1 Tax=Clostridium septicum TaxID=1504 RepID=A0A9N7PL43_CLOSE|nr:hypothetical protein [Clostridium septicum]AYE33482.1 hypothetical protein CP523_02875 [Clostridium septicum]MDU1314907.1 hypothetical protein [Clostridium septicum]QAS61653.1 hypothetical protein EI377_13400 [Clostridium septicum]UEC21908.1 hypothetical protein LK444_05985 [Clostridium septicum]USS00061.1 hypothetical protein NH397_11210 [Clostridium septicum]